MRRRRDLLLATARQYIEGYCNVYNDTFSFKIRYVGGSLTQVSANTDSNGYWKFYIPRGSRVSRMLFTNISQVESNKLTEITFSTNFDFSGIANYGYLFGLSSTIYFACTNLVSVFNLGVSSSCTTLYRLCNGCTSLTTIDVSNWDVSNATNLSALFYNCSSLTNLNVSNWDTGNVTSMVYMFSNCSSLTSINVSNFDTSNVTTMGYMFNGCSSLTTLDVSNWNISNVITMKHMFSECSSLTSLDVSNWDTSNVTTINYMFNVCQAIISLDLSNWDMSSITDSTGAFRQMSALTSFQFPSNFTTVNCTTINGIFHGVSRNLFNGDFSWLVVSSGCVTTYWNTSSAFIQNPITSIGNISASISFEYHSLTLASANKVLDALQTVTSETLTFSSTTKALINADQATLDKVNAKRAIGWTIVL